MTNPALIETEDEVVIAGTIHAYARIFGAELGEQVNSTLTAKASTSWFVALKQNRKDANMVVYDDYRDPRFLLKEALANDGIVHYGIANFGPEWKNVAATVRRRLNAWFHGSLEPNLATFVEIVDGLRFLAERSNLPVANDLIANVNRARSIREGKYVSKSDAERTPLTQDDKEFIERLKAKKAEITKRPPVGSEWLGSKGIRKIVISKVLGDVTEKGVSILHQLGGHPEEVLANWLRYYPKGGEAKVAEDGAVMGYIKGLPYLIGWLHEKHDSAQGEIRGFSSENEYIFTGSDVRDIVSGKLLSMETTESSSDLMAKLQSHLAVGDVLAITPYGEILAQSDAAELQIVAIAHKNNWFKGHLPG